MRKLIVISLALLLCLASVALMRPSSARKDSRLASARGEIIVKFKEGALVASSSTSEIDTQTLSREPRQTRLQMLAETAGAAAGRLRSNSFDALAPTAPATPTTKMTPARELISRYGFDRTVVMQFAADDDLDEVLARLRANEAVEYAEPNYAVEVGAIFPGDPRFGEQWALRNLGLGVGGYPATWKSDIKATEAWEITTGSADVIVAVTDTGLDAIHPDLAPNLYTNPREIPGNGVDDDNNGYADDVHGYDVVARSGDISDVSGHGSEMSGIIAAKMDNGIGISGVSQSKILPVKFFRRVGPRPEDVTGDIAGAAKALLYAIAAGAKIINASWSQSQISETDLQTLTNAVSATNDAGILLVCIAGNRGTNLDFNNLYPAKLGFPNQIVVAASEFNDDIWHPPFDPYSIKSGYGKNSVDLAAPGVAILTTAAHGDCLECVSSSNPADWYRVIDGTSAAAAYVSGVAALIKSQYPDATVIALKRRLLESVEPREQLRDYVKTGGRLNARDALTIPLPITPPALTRLKIKANGKTFVFGDNMQSGAVLVIGSTTYPARYNAGDLSRLVTRLPLDLFPPGVPVPVRLRNPDGGESQPLTITR